MKALSVYCSDGRCSACKGAIWSCSCGCHDVGGVAAEGSASLDRAPHPQPSPSASRGDTEREDRDESPLDGTLAAPTSLHITGWSAVCDNGCCRPPLGACGYRVTLADASGREGVVFTEHREMVVALLDEFGPVVGQPIGDDRPLDRFLAYVARDVAS